MLTKKTLIYRNQQLEEESNNQQEAIKKLESELKKSCQRKKEKLQTQIQELDQKPHQNTNLTKKKKKDITTLSLLG